MNAGIPSCLALTPRPLADRDRGHGDIPTRKRGAADSSAECGPRQGPSRNAGRLAVEYFALHHLTKASRKSPGGASAVPFRTTASHPRAMGRQNQAWLARHYARYTVHAALALYRVEGPRGSVRPRERQDAGAARARRRAETLCRRPRR